METAIEQEQKAFDFVKARKLRMVRRKAKFHRHLWSYIIVIGALILFNIFTPGPWWFQWPTLGWGIGMAFHFRAAFSQQERNWNWSCGMEIDNDKNFSET
ncbi:2TM domain-containing protein [Thermodesulfobacteriota bacterium]